MSSRLIIRNIPKDVSEDDLRRHVATVFHPPLTDCKVIRKRFSETSGHSGVSRMFAYIGFKTEKEAETAKQLLNKTFLKTRKLQVDFAFAEGSPNLPRAWSAITKSKATAKKRAIISGDALQWLTTKKRRQEEANISAADTGRLRVLNVPFDLTEEEIRAELSRFGAIADLTVPKSETDELHNRGFFFVTFQYPEHACVCLEAMDGKIFQGRKLSVEAADFAVRHEKITDTDKVVGSRKKCAAKLQLEEQKRERYARDASWNLLFVSAAAAVDILADQLGVSKEDMLNLQASDSLAARAAIAETLILKQTLEWLERRGLSLEHFQSVGAAPISCRLGHQGTARSETMLVVKHLGPWVELEKLQEKFERYGQLSNLTLCPTKTLGLVDYVEPTSAKKAMDALNMSKFYDRPLFLEWAPATFSKAATAGFASNSTTNPEVEETLPKEKESIAEGALSKETEIVVQETEDLPPKAVFVKNLNFATTEDELTKLFRKMAGFKFVKIMQRAKKEKDLKTGLISERKVSAGYGFVYFESTNNCVEFMKRFVGHVVDGHVLQLSISQPNKKPKPLHTRKSEEEFAPMESTRKLMIKNLPFEANVKDVRQLFEVFGSVSAVRIPKKRDGSSRGFGFVEFATKKDAKDAFNALQHTHLLGRHLVLIPVSEQAETETGPGAD
eukprot:Gregarina_sp_Poly_1__10748@NODE_81_length_15589_cov_30_056114_g69_i0_p2_GENE_NODE_81_length_15589_cov_30_056114_g69_i0NODE_81_length_15589_cov_30_056114_g69_i0_p2_ORF_typecomplete_len672_score130_71RRM_1/PF00076_22/2_4e11RRM_1/PF00076_22/1_8e14RRM_1/PF00076_22/9_4e08RRM_1/PF00076_22/5_4e10RRM_1/PF00076_22/2_1e19RRM_5/PF13893_6/0_36RRM_5/PF13893_6/8_6RRM_5/PF13893_6/0_0018RRM_5/PF13893_6/1_2RRM_5/PF13893_6/1_6e07RRM_7/PF16367_5/1_3e02RRM_7/PF16367_5/0_0085RRM_7/PF16367_5/9_8e02RRM_7/PF16367_5/0_0